MALPTAAIDRLFARLAISYGTEFTNKWGTLSSTEVKSHWAHELGIFNDNLARYRLGIAKLARPLSEPD
jgi:hypothetical protein